MGGRGSAAIVGLLGLGAAACQSSVTPLPPPPIASYGSEEASVAHIDPGRWTGSTFIDGSSPPPTRPVVAQARRSVPSAPVRNDPAVGDRAPAVFLGPGRTYGPAAETPVDVYEPVDSAPHAGAIVQEESGHFEMRPIPGSARPAFVDRPFVWHSTWTQAQADAREQGKLVLVMATRQNCGLCDQFRDSIVPSRAADVGAASVGHIYNIQNVRRGDPVDAALRAGLARSQGRPSLMPLVGFFTPDMQFVSGFWGERTTSQFGADLARVQASVPRQTMMPTGEPQFERVWVPAARPWPQPGERLAGAETGATAPYTPYSPSYTPPEPRVAEPAWQGDAADWLPPTGAPIDMPSGVATQVDPPSFAGTTTPSTLPEPFPMHDTSRGSPALAREVAADAGPWGSDVLLSAYAHIRGGRYLAAQQALTQVSQRLPGTAAEREALKGQVAIFNAKRLESTTDEGERSRLRERARRDLAGTLWSGLFS